MNKYKMNKELIDYINNYYDIYKLISLNNNSSTEEINKDIKDIKKYLLSLDYIIIEENLDDKYSLIKLELDDNDISYSIEDFYINRLLKKNNMNYYYINMDDISNKELINLIDFSELLNIDLDESYYLKEYLKSKEIIYLNEKEILYFLNNKYSGYNSIEELNDEILINDENINQSSIEEYMNQLD